MEIAESTEYRPDHPGEEGQTMDAHAASRPLVYNAGLELSRIPT